eukprot:m.466307 g.466307  ORF g.466307 m.466307 type:complete len:416 (+) comp25097_c0_seq1:51-1298(+)
MRRCHQWVAILVATLIKTPLGATPYTHSWDKVGDLLGMHGAFKASEISQSDIDFVAHTYPMITLAGSCNGLNASFTLEDAMLDVTTKIKASNPKATVGMYWRSDFAMEIADCSSFASVWAAHPQWHLKADNGTAIMRGQFYYIDYSNPAAAAFFAQVLVNVTTFMLPNGKPVIDYIYIDGDPPQSSTSSIYPGIGPTRSAELVHDVYACFGDIQRQLDSRGYGQNVILNAMDAMWNAQTYASVGVAGAMFDHWSILQFVDTATGNFSLDAMSQAIQLMNSSVTANLTIKVKGWPGPIVHQRDIYPPTLPQPKTFADFQKVAAERYNSELALFLLVASEHDYWVYSWFWSFDDYVPNHPDSTVPPDFFPEARCPLGPPLGPPIQVSNTKYTRSFEQASVVVDLSDRTASRVTFTAC